MSAKTVLVVDDIPLMRTMLGKFLAMIEHRSLAREGCELRIVEARDGVEALQKTREHAVDLIFLDLMMPAMDGVTFLEKLKAEPASAGIRVVVTTALAEASALARARELGADSFIRKPYTLDAIEVELRKSICPDPRDEDLTGRVDAEAGKGGEGTPLTDVAIGDTVSRQRS